MGALPCVPWAKVGVPSVLCLGIYPFETDFGSATEKVCSASSFQVGVPCRRPPAGGRDFGNAAGGRSGFLVSKWVSLGGRLRSRWVSLWRTTFGGRIPLADLGGCPFGVAPLALWRRGPQVGVPFGGCPFWRMPSRVSLEDRLLTGHMQRAFRHQRAGRRYGAK